MDGDELNSLGETVRSVRAESLADARPFPSFATYVERCLYDPAFGYYASGRVDISERGHFGTYPELLGPLFGAMVAESVREFWAAFEATGALDGDDPFTVLELGGGTGTLAHHVLTHVESVAETERWRPYADRLDYVVGESSPVLRKRQRERLAPFVRTDRAAVREMDARNVSWDGPFTGVVVSNELIDVFPPERLRVYGVGDVSRIHVVPTVPASVAAEWGVAAESPSVSIAADGRVAIPGAELWRMLAAEDGFGEWETVRFVELEVPLSCGWLDEEGETTSPASIESYLENVEPLVADLAAVDELPVDLHCATSLPAFADGLADLLSGPDCVGAALLVDYGGTSRYVLDPNSADDHVRIYGPDRELAHSPSVYHDPGGYDITWDVDFTELARILHDSGLETPFYGHQSGLEGPLREVAFEDAVEALATTIRDRLAADGTDPEREAVFEETVRRVARFREAPNFSLLVVGAPDGAYGGWFGDADPLDVSALRTLTPNVGSEELATALAAADLPREISTVLSPCCDPISSLSSYGLYRFRDGTMSVLESEKWLVDPGELADDGGQ